MNRLIRFFLILISVSFLSADDDLEDKYKLGKHIYYQTCVSCHGEDGKAQTNLQLVVRPRDLTKTILTEEQSYLITKDGAHYWGAKADIMPAFKYTYNEEELRAVAYYISKKFHPDNQSRIDKIYNESKKIEKEDIPKMLKRGEKIYKRNCKYCHGDSGEGNGIATKNPVDSIFPYNLKKTLLSQKQIFLYIKHGGHYWGTSKDDMPAWKVKYNDFTLKSTAKYVDEIIRKK